MSASNVSSQEFSFVNSSNSSKIDVSFKNLFPPKPQLIIIKENDHNSNSLSIQEESIKSLIQQDDKDKEKQQEGGFVV